MLSRCLALVLVVASPSALAASAEKPPNILLIVSDDQAWTDYGFMGHEEIQTPNLDALAAESAVFTNGYVPTSLCRPSLATLISGLYPHQHKISGNDPIPRNEREKMLRHIRRIPKLPKLLSEKGYVSLQTGKWWEGNFSEGGFTEGMTHGDPKRGGRHGDEGLTIGREGLEPVWNFLDEHPEEPFFIWYAPFMPHLPHNPPARLLEHYRSPERPIKLARYYAMCEWFDESCGLLLDGLDERGLAESTLVIYVTDNGWIQRTSKTKLPQGWKKPYAPKSKRSPYDGGLRTPIMLRWPGQTGQDRFETLVSSIDIAPTILAAAGVEAPDAMHGLNLLDLIAAGGQADRTAVFGATYQHDVPDVENPAAGLMFRWCRQGDWKLILSPDRHVAPELFDLADDPHETKNLAAKHPERVTALRADLDRWWTPGRE